MSPARGNRDSKTPLRLAGVAFGRNSFGPISRGPGVVGSTGYGQNSRGLGVVYLMGLAMSGSQFRLSPLGADSGALDKDRGQEPDSA